MSWEYQDFITQKLVRSIPTGMSDPPDPNPGLFPHQQDLVRWALRRGRSLIAADTGLGKTRIELEWANVVALHTERPCLILAPLAVGPQIVAEAEQIGISAIEVRHQPTQHSPIFVTNYERLHLFDPSWFGSVVLDESSIIKHHNAKTLAQLMDAFGRHAWKLCATATPSPNDYTELGTHAEFLGICSRSEMLSEFFVHDGGETQTWRLKGHARAPFWRWVASWAAMIRLPSDLGHDDTGYILPPLALHQITVPASPEDVAAQGRLLAMEAQTLMERRSARRATVGSRVAEVAALANADRDEPWVVWCDLNAESEALTRAIDGAVEVRGSMSIEEKESKLRMFARGDARVLVSKPSIAGHGMNWQHCARMAFVGVSDSWESWYQAVRRCYRFGQKRNVHVYVVSSELEGAVVANLQRKERDAKAMADELSGMTRDSVRENVTGQQRSTNLYRPAVGMEVPSWLM